MTIVLQIVLSLAAQEMVRYDKLTLLDGSVITGQVEREDDRAIMIRVIKDQGSVNYLRRVFKKDLAYREFVDLPQSRSPVDGESLQPSATELIEDKPAFLKAIIAEWEIRNIEPAARGLLKLLNQCSAQDLEELNALARQRVKMPLAQFAAQVHLKFSLSRAEDGFFKLYFLSHATLKETYQLLEKTFRESFAVGFTCPGHPPGGESCGRTDTIAQWIDSPAQYDGDGLHAAQFQRHITRVMGLARELVRLSQTLRKEREFITGLNSDRERLRELLKVVSARKSGR